MLIFYAADNKILQIHTEMTKNVLEITNPDVHCINLQNYLIPLVRIVDSYYSTTSRMTPDLTCIETHYTTDLA